MEAECSLQGGPHVLEYVIYVIVHPCNNRAEKTGLWTVKYHKMIVDTVILCSTNSKMFAQNKVCDRNKYLDLLVIILKLNLIILNKAGP